MGFHDTYSTSVPSDMKKYEDLGASRGVDVLAGHGGLNILHAMGVNESRQRAHVMNPENDHQPY